MVVIDIVNVGPIVIEVMVGVILIKCANLFMTVTNKLRVQVIVIIIKINFIKN